MLFMLGWPCLVSSLQCTMCWNAELQFDELSDNYLLQEEKLHGH